MPDYLYLKKTHIRKHKRGALRSTVKRTQKTTLCSGRVLEA